MCLHSKVCNCLVTAFLATKIAFCPYVKGECSYLEEAIKEEPDIPTKILNYDPLPAGDQAIVVSGSALFARFAHLGLGRHVATLPDGRNIYGIDPTSISTIFVITDDKTGEKTSIDLETLREENIE